MESALFTKCDSLSIKNIEKLKKSDIAFVEFATARPLLSFQQIIDTIEKVVRYCGDEAFSILLEKVDVNVIHHSFYEIYAKNVFHPNADLFFGKIGKLPRSVVSKILFGMKESERVAIILCKIFVSNAPIPSQREINYLRFFNHQKEIYRYAYRLCASWKKTRILKMLLEKEIEKEEKILFFFGGESNNFYFRFIVKNIISRKEEKY